MRGREDIFLTQSLIEEMSLFRRIINARSSQTPVAERLEMERKGQPLVTEVNLKQIAALTKRNYGAVYNTYNSLVASLNEMTKTRSNAVKKLFNVPTSALRWHLVQQGHPYHFLHTLLYHDYPDFGAFLTAEDTSKATMLRHLKALRDFSRDFGVRFSYESLAIQGEEKRVRLFLTMILWMATDGTGWPFPDLSRQQMGKIVDGAVQLYDIGQPNYVTREIAMYYAAISQLRANDGHAIGYAASGMTLQYPVANMFEELQSQLEAGFSFPALAPDEQMGESAAMYFMFNFLPFFTTTNDEMLAKTMAKFKHYNHPIYVLATEFLAKLPVAFLMNQQLPKPALNMLQANLLANTVSTLAFGEDLSRTIAYAINERLVQMPANKALEVKVRQTLENIIFQHQYTALEPYLDKLVQSYYSNVLQVAMQFVPKTKVRVAPVIEQTVLGYVDLLGFLMAQPFVEVLASDEDLATADLIIESATIPDASQYRQGQLTFKWAASSSNDWYGELYSELRQIWDNKTAIEGGNDLDY